MAMISAYLISSKFCFNPRRSDVRIVVSCGRKGEAEGENLGKTNDHPKELSECGTSYGEGQHLAYKKHVGYPSDL